MDSISSLVGLPVNYNILYIWFNVDVPGNIALPEYIYPRIHPTDHISTDLV